MAGKSAENRANDREQYRPGCYRAVRRFTDETWNARRRLRTLMEGSQCTPHRETCLGLVGYNQMESYADESTAYLQMY